MRTPPRVSAVRTCLSLLLAALGTLLPASVAAQQYEDPEEVLERFERAVNARDVDAAAAFFAEDATLQADGLLSGREEIRRWLREQVDGNVHVHMGSYRTDGERVAWSAEIGEGDWWRRGQAPLTGSGEAVIRRGKIERLSYSVRPVDVRSAPATTLWDVPRAGAPENPLTGLAPFLAGGAALGAALLGVTLLRRRRRQLERSAEWERLVQRGQLVSSLQHWADSRRR